MRTLLNALNAQDRLQTAESTFQTEVADVAYRSANNVRTVKVDSFTTAIDALRITPPTDKLVSEQYEVVKRLVDEIGKCRECLEPDEVEALERQPNTISEESSEAFVYLLGKQAHENLKFTDTLLKQKLESVSAAAEREECSFCLEALGDDTILRCNHKFHTDCMREWLVMAPAPTCPLCRDPLQYLLATPDFQSTADRAREQEPADAGYRPSLEGPFFYRSDRLRHNEYMLVQDMRERAEEEPVYR